MRWIAIFTDTPAMLAVRAQQGQAHLDFLARHKAEIVLAGGCAAMPAATTSTACGCWKCPTVPGLWR